jgi:hypothetical protein
VAARCEKTDLLTESCGHCAGAEARAAREARAEAAPGPLFTAEYEGECSGCGGGIIPGDTIRAAGNCRGYLCGECGSETAITG